MKFVLVIHIMISIMAMANHILLYKEVRRKFRLERKREPVERVMAFVYSALICMLPGINIAVAFLPRKWVMERVVNDPEYVRVEEANQ